MRTWGIYGILPSNIGDFHGFSWILMDFGHIQVNTPTFDENMWEQFDDCGSERHCDGKFICEEDKTKH